jgi:plastocyanin
MAERAATRRRGLRLRRRHALIAVPLGAGAAIVFAAVSLAAGPTVEATNSSTAWTNGTPPAITTAETVTFKNSTTTSLPHGVHWNSPPATPSCAAGVPVDSSSSANWSGDCSFSQAGTYQFVCTVHSPMTGTIMVTSSGPGAPIVSTSAATSITDTGATLKGSVNPNGLATEYFFKYGTSATPYASETGKTSVPAGTSPVTASTPVSGLTAATTYHFKLFAENSSSPTPVEGSDLTFRTTGPPLPTTSTATSVSNTTATLKGSVNPNGLATKYFFKYGTSATPYASETGKTQVSAGTSPVTASTGVSGLTPETTYHFRLFAENTSGTTEAGDLTFTTTATPVDTTDPTTTIKGKPADPSSSTTAEFTYESSEAGSTFECKMDGEPFTECASTGKTYTGLSEGQHTFQVRATDPSLNTDESPAVYSFSVVLPVTPPEVIPPKVDPPPAVAPNTTITLKPKAKTKDRTPTFKFKSSVAGATYECKLDGKALKSCRSPLTTKPLSYAKHTLKVAAIVGGLKDSSPAVASFKVVKPK